MRQECHLVRNDGRRRSRYSRADPSLPGGGRSDPSGLQARRRGVRATQLAGFLRGLAPPDVLGAWGEQLSASVARMVVASQLLIATYSEILADRCSHPDVAAIREHFHGRKQALEAVQASMANLVDHEPVHDDKRVAWQQGEINTAIRRLERARHRGSLSRALLQLLRQGSPRDRASETG